MAKVLTSPKYGSVGPSTFQRGRTGIIQRQRVWPIDPKTPRQLDHRAAVEVASKQWRFLTDTERAGWRALGAQLRNHLTGQQAYNKVNITLIKCGQPTQATAPALPALGVLSCAGLLAEATPRLQLRQVAERGGAADFLIIEASAPLSPGIDYVKDRFRFLTVVASPGGIAADLDLTTAYLARFQVLTGGDRLVVRLRAMKNGFTGEPLQLSTLIAEAGA